MSYMLFGGKYELRSGGWDDHIDTFETVREAKIVAEDYRRRGFFDWGHIVCTEDQVVEMEYCKNHGWFYND